jgi:hypothetical protein
MKAHYAIVDACMPEWPVLLPRDAEQVRNDTRAFVVGELVLMPWFVAVPLSILQLVFLMVVFIVAGGVPLDKQSSHQRLQSMERWCALGLPFRSFLRLYRSLVLLAFLEHRLVRSSLGLPDLIMHQRLHRQARLITLQVDNTP